MTAAGVTLRVPSRVLLRLLWADAALALAFLFWLRIPDSHTWEFLLSMLILAGLVFAFLRLHLVTLQALREPAGSGYPQTSAAALSPARKPRRLSYLILALWLALWFFLIRAAQAFFYPNTNGRRAGYWNSRLPPHLRDNLPYDRLVRWQHNLLEILLWWVLPTLLLPFLIESVARAVRTLRERPTWRVLRRPALWLGTLAAALAAFWLTTWLNEWVPGHSTATQLTSLILRYGLIYGIDTAIYAFLIAFIAGLLAREHAGGNPVP